MLTLTRIFLISMLSVLLFVVPRANAGGDTVYHQGPGGPHFNYGGVYVTDYGNHYTRTAYRSRGHYRHRSHYGYRYAHYYRNYYHYRYPYKYRQYQYYRYRDPYSYRYYYYRYPYYYRGYYRTNRNRW